MDEPRRPSSALLPGEVAKIEEARQAHGVAETSVESIDLAGGKACYSEPGSWQNQAAGLAMSEAISEPELDRLGAFYAERGVAARVEVCPYADASLLSGLAARGFVACDQESVLYRELDATEPDRTGPPVADLWCEGASVRVVDRGSPADVEAYLDVHLRGFDPVLVGPFEGAQRRVLQHARTVSLLVEVDGVPAAVAALELASPVAALFGGTVLGPFRRRGLQRALIAHRLELARSAGCTLATIQSTPGHTTERNAWAAGFAMAYTKATFEASVERLRRP